MKFPAIVVAGVLTAGPAQPDVAYADGRSRAGRVTGLDVSNWTGDLNWRRVAAGGARFAFVHATEGLDYRNPRFARQFRGAKAAGLFRGAYHFAQPHESGGAAQAAYFVRHGGRWRADGRTLPGVLDVEPNPYRAKNKLDQCYGLNRRKMVRWIEAFARRYRALTRRNVGIYTTTAWWRDCTGNATGFTGNPLWLASWARKAGRLPASWQRYTFWQHDDKGSHGGGADRFNGTRAQLRRLAGGGARPERSGKEAR